MNQMRRKRKKRLNIVILEALVLSVSGMVLIGAFFLFENSPKSSGMEPVVNEDNDEPKASDNAKNDISIQAEQEVVEEEPMTSEDADKAIKAIIAEKEKLYDTDSEYAWLCQHKSLFPEEKVDAAEGNAGLIHFLYQYGMNEFKLHPNFELTEEELTSEMPLLMQWDERWGFEDYGSYNVGISGCGPTCLSMILLGFTNNAELTPKFIGDYAMANEYYMYGTGTMWALFTDFSALYGVTCNELTTTKEEEIVGELKKGKPVICSMRRGHFTRIGHFIILRSIDEDGTITVNDPNSLKNSESEWRFEDFSKEIAHAWSFEI